jgi:hypothetical protein
MKDKLLRELGEATSRVTRSEVEWKKLSKSVATLEAELDAERKKQYALFVVFSHGFRPRV